MDLKKSLRKKMKELRSAAKDRAERDERIFERLFSLSDFLAAERYFLYRSFQSEADTERIARELLHRGKTIFYPRVKGETIELVRYVGQDFVFNRYGIGEPVGKAEKIRPQVCVVPMLAADRHGNRLGYGGGYYDRFFAENGDVLKIGICYDFQIVDELPVEEQDVRMDKLVTDLRILENDIGD